MNLNKYVPTILDNLIWILLLGVVFFFSIFAEGFLDTGSFLNILVHAAVLGLLVIGESFVLITGNFDLSIESTLGFCAMLGAWLILPMGPPENGSGLMMYPLFAVAIILLIGPLIGWINGTLITRGRMNNFVVTLGMLILLRGLMLLIPRGNTIYRTPPLYNVLGAAKIGPIPLPVIVVLIAFAIAHIVLSYTPFGRNLYAVGGNKEAALASGVDPDKRIRQVYIIAGLLAAIGGWMLTGRGRSVVPNMGEGMVFEVFAAPKPSEDSPVTGRVRGLDGTYTVYSLEAVLPGRPESIPLAQRDAGKAQLAQDSGIGDYLAFVQSLYNDAEVLINQDALEEQDLLQ